VYYVKTTDKSVDDAAKDLETAVAKHRFGVLHVYDLQDTLKGKGFDLPHECRILEICNPAQAVNVLSVDMSLNMALPCRVSVYEQDGKTCVGTIRPTKLLATLSQDEKLAKTAAEVEAVIMRIIDDAV